MILLLVLEIREIQIILSFYDLVLLLFHNPLFLSDCCKKVVSEPWWSLHLKLCANLCVLLCISVCCIPKGETGVSLIAERNLGLRTCILWKHVLLVETPVVQAHLTFLTLQKNNVRARHLESFFHFVDALRKKEKWGRWRLGESHHPFLSYCLQLNSSIQGAVLDFWTAAWPLLLLFLAMSILYLRK